VYFAAALALSVVGAPRLRHALAVAGAAAALLLILLQGLVIGAWCKLCLVADPAAIGYGLAVLAGASTVRFTAARALGAAPALLATIGALALWTQSAPPRIEMPPGTPEFVEHAQAADAATVVEVVDFECPFCRRMQAQLTAAIEKAKTPVRVVRKMLPLRQHPHAMPAALAYCCADAQGKGDAMAAALFAAEPDELTPEGCEKLAARVGCDLERYRRDLPHAQSRVDIESAEAMAAGIHSIPTLYVGGERVVGASRSTEELTAMLERAAPATR
jgi:predicted DsbA family dithiol-disulfide isomerase